MKVVVDDKIPYIREELAQIASEVVYISGVRIDADSVKDADALIIRTRTKCNESLLKGSKVKFIATATIGFDHIDTDYCDRNGIFWTNAPGSNSGSVAQYIHSALLLLKKEKGIDFKNLCIGIIGVGNVGKKVSELSQSVGMRVLHNDPPLTDQGQTPENLVFTDIKTIAQECDIITFHTPLNQDGRYNTFHLADESFFRSLQKEPIIINTSRGEVIDTFALVHAMETGKVGEVILDVWENEPRINLSLLSQSYLGTPHIAGYSADGKANATRMSLEALCRFFVIEKKIEITPPPPEQPYLRVNTLDEAYLTIYNPENDSKALKNFPGHFEQLRGNYPIRREEKAYHIELINPLGCGS